jgi:hypothetical protein
MAAGGTPGFSIPRWHANPAFDGFIGQLQQASQAAYTTSPSSKDLPALLLPEPLPANSQLFVELNTVLAEFAVEQGQIQAS